MGRAEMERTWKPIVAGILCIIDGLICVIPCILVAFFFLLYGGVVGVGWLTLAGALLVIVGIMPIVGGIYALRRRRWGLALAGSIFTLLNCVVLGVLGTVVYIGAIADNFSVQPSDLTPFVTILIVGLAVFGILALIALILVILGRREFK
jgi:amino acid transporter